VPVKRIHTAEPLARISPRANSAIGSFSLRATDWCYCAALLLRSSGCSFGFRRV
jgi:hypothetical protein